ncbi:MAG: tRNA (adenosine(37)-N6)-threonylcarbamoyltransferase complex ATPase subunit type 1 TsaE [Candidatus Aminicenantales bacterium]
MKKKNEPLSQTEKPGREKRFVSFSEEDTFELGRKLAQRLKGDEIVFISGELGAGKTVFVRGIASGLGLKDVHQVCSPCYTLINIYEAKFPIYHLDLYRIEKGDEIQELGWEDFIGEGVIVVEWAEKMPAELDVIQVKIEVDKEDRRIISITW